MNLVILTNRFHGFLLKWGLVCSVGLCFISWSSSSKYIRNLGVHLLVVSSITIITAKLSNRRSARKEVRFTWLLILFKDFFSSCCIQLKDFVLNFIVSIWCLGLVHLKIYILLLFLVCILNRLEICACKPFWINFFRFHFLNLWLIKYYYK